MDQAPGEIAEVSHIARLRQRLALLQSFKDGIEEL